MAKKKNSSLLLLLLLGGGGLAWYLSRKKDVPADIPGQVVQPQILLPDVEPYTVPPVKQLPIIQPVQPVVPDTDTGTMTPGTIPTGNPCVSNAFRRSRNDTGELSCFV